jgi:TatD DNase family protein
VVDTHAHLGLCEPADNELVEATRSAGVDRVLTVGMDEDSNREAIATAERYGEVFASVGRHPNSAAGFDAQAAADIEDLAAHPRVRAIGEAGLDYYRERAPREDQRRAFEAQIGIARGSGLPLVIHMRDGVAGGGDVAAAGTDGGPDTACREAADAVAETFEILASEAEGVTVILHCYSGGPGRVEEAARRGWHCSFAGNLTYPKAEALREAARLVPLELLLVETDSPFLAPQPVRGKPNQPANVVATGRRLAELRGLAYEELEAVVEANAARVFGW